MDFQPLVDDLDSSGSNKIVIFSNDSLIIFNSNLGILSQAKVGSILGQPALYNLDNDNNLEIIFNAKQSNNNYLLAYQYSSNILQQELNITLTNEANMSGIKCLKINGINSCVFKDRKNYVHVVDLDSGTDSFYNTSVYEETKTTAVVFGEVTKQIIPAIGDIDNDGNQDAVFWFNQDNDSGYGFLAFDLVDRKVKWVVDNIFSPRTLRAGIEFFVLKGQPVLVDLNNDNKLEIAASVFYDDSCLPDICTDWFTELHVYNYNGTKRFSKCGLNTMSNGCNDGFTLPGTPGSQWEGTNPFVMDFDENGVNDICFIKDEKYIFAFIYMGLACYDYNGNQIAKVNLSERNLNIGMGNAMAADMNNDGRMDIVTLNDVYSSDGKVLFNIPSLERYHPVAVDLDGNNGLDLIWTAKSKTKVFLDSNAYTTDLAVSSSGITFSKTDDKRINVSAVIRNNGNLNAKNVKIVVYNAETLENNTAIADINGNRDYSFSSILALNEGHSVLVNADYDNEIKETDESNNFAYKEFNGLPYVFVNTNNLEPFNIQSEFKKYIKNKLTSGYYTENEAEADVKVYIGKNNPRNKDNNNIKTLNDFDIGYGYGNIIYNDETALNPYAGLIEAFKDSNERNVIMIVGNEIEGDIAAAKEFIRNQAEILNTGNFNSVFIDDENTDAIKVYDYLHLSGNDANYKSQNDAFKAIVRNVLNDEMFTVEDKTVQTTSGITLRLRNLKPGVSSNYLDYLSSTGVPVELPVVLSRGIHSNLSSWEVLGSELANEGRDLWLIEITGGPGQDCDNCSNYQFSDLTDDYWPALINGVLSFTGKNKIQYVGHSNGGRVAIASLENGMMDPNKIDTLIGVAVPSAFEGYSTFGKYFGKYGEQIMNELNDRTHVSLTEIGGEMENICLNKAEFGCFILTQGLKSANKMSFNTDKQYYLWINDTTDQQIGQNLQLDNFYLIEGWVEDDKNKSITHDFIVTEQDERAIYNNIISSNKKLYKLWGAHTAGWNFASVPDRGLTKSIIKDALNKKPLNRYESNEIEST